MRLLILAAFLLAPAAFAQDGGTPLDAPVELKKGEPFPFDNGLALSGPQSVHQAKRVADCEATLGAIEKKDSVIPTAVLIAGVVGGVAAVFAAGYCAGVPGHCDPTRH